MMKMVILIILILIIIIMIIIIIIIIYPGLHNLKRVKAKITAAQPGWDR